MSRKQLLDLSLFDDDRKSEMVFKRPQIIRRSDPSVYDKPEPQRVSQTSKCNYFTTAPYIKNRELSNVELENPQCWDYLIGYSLTFVWLCTVVLNLPSYHMLPGNILHKATQMGILKLVAVSSSLLTEPSLLETTHHTRPRNYIQGAVLLGLIILLISYLVEHLALNSISLILACDCVVSIMIERPNFRYYSIIILPVVYFVHPFELILAVVAFVLSYRLQVLELRPVQQIISSGITTIVFVGVSFLNAPYFVYNGWTFCALAIRIVEQQLSHKLMPIINKRYVRQPIVYGILKSSTFFLALGEHSFQLPLYFTFVIIVTLYQIWCETILKEIEQRKTLILQAF